MAVPALGWWRQEDPEFKSSLAPQQVGGQSELHKTLFGKKLNQNNKEKAQQRFFGDIKDSLIDVTCTELRSEGSWGERARGMG